MTNHPILDSIVLQARALSMAASRAGIDASDAYEVERLAHAYSAAKGRVFREGVKRMRALLAGLDQRVQAKGEV